MKNKIEPLIIKKYENRRLYNTVTSQYINQEQVAELVREGHDVRVVDAATGEDITRLVLAQIVLEDAKTPNSVFPLDVLRQMIVASGKATQENALRYMKTMLEVYQNMYRAMPSPLNPFEFMPGVWGQGKGKENPPGAPGQFAGSREHPGTGGASEAANPEVRELRQRIEEMEAALAQRRPAKKARKKSSRRKS